MLQQQNLENVLVSGTRSLWERWGLDERRVCALQFFPGGIISLRHQPSEIMYCKHTPSPRQHGLFQLFPSWWRADRERECVKFRLQQNNCRKETDTWKKRTTWLISDINMAAIHGPSCYSGNSLLLSVISYWIVVVQIVLVLISNSIYMVSAFKTITNLHLWKVLLEMSICTTFL